MEKICFIGVFDKTDLLIYISRILVEMGKKVLVIDSTVNQKAKYVVPSINPTTSYVTEYDNEGRILKFIDCTRKEKISYDYVY